MVVMWHQDVMSCLVILLSSGAPGIKKLLSILVSCVTAHRHHHPPEIVRSLSYLKKSHLWLCLPRISCAFDTHTHTHTHTLCLPRTSPPARVGYITGGPRVGE